MKEKEDQDFITITQSEFLASVDYVLVNYIQPEAGHAIVDLKTNGSSSLVIDFKAMVEGLYYVGIVQKPSQEQLTTQRAQLRVDPVNKDERALEILNTGFDDLRVNFFAGRYCDDVYLGGASSQEKVTWTKLYLKARENHFLFVNAEQDLQEFILWAQGPSIISFEPKKLQKREVNIISHVLNGSFDVHHLCNVKYDDDILRVGYKILSSGFAILTVRNYTMFDLACTLILKNARNVRICKKKIFDFFIFSNFWKNINF